MRLKFAEIKSSEDRGQSELSQDIFIFYTFISSLNHYFGMEQLAVDEDNVSCHTSVSLSYFKF